MLLKIHKRILNLMIHAGVATDCVITTSYNTVHRGTLMWHDVAKELKIKESSVVIALRELERMGYVEPQRESETRLVGYRLSVLGMCWREEQRSRLLHYILDKWFDALAIIVSIVALICSGL